MPTSIPTTIARSGKSSATDLGLTAFVALPVVILLIALLVARQGGMSLAEYGLAFAQYASL